MQPQRGPLVLSEAGLQHKCASTCNHARKISSIAGESSPDGRDPECTLPLIEGDNNSITAPPGVPIAALPGELATV